MFYWCYVVYLDCLFVVLFTLIAILFIWIVYSLCCSLSLLFCYLDCVFVVLLTLIVIWPSMLTSSITSDSMYGLSIRWHQQWFMVLYQCLFNLNVILFILCFTGVILFIYFLLFIYIVYSLCCSLLLLYDVQC
jgi:hypothetical protein